jgi:hypothetical protein
VAWGFSFSYARTSAFFTECAIVTKEEVEKALEDLRRISGAQQDRLRVTPGWSEKTRDNEKDGNVVPKPGASHG